MASTFIKHWHLNSREYYVNGEPIKNILVKSNITYIDLITIDVEGGEQVVLETLDFSIPIYVICIELDSNNIEKDANCRSILKKHGFTFKKRININEFWVNENYYRKNILYDSFKIKNRNFTNINELGNFLFLENHIKEEVEIALKNII